MRVKIKDLRVGDRLHVEALGYCTVTRLSEKPMVVANRRSGPRYYSIVYQDYICFVEAIPHVD